METLLSDYPCKYDYLCKKTGHYNPAHTLNKPCNPLNPCTHGGGCSCRSWKKHTSKELGWDNPLPKRKGETNPVLY